MERTNEHHHFWQRREYLKTPTTTRVREHILSKTRMVVPVHNELHNYIDPLPPPNKEMAKFILERLDSYPATYTSLDAIQAVADDIYDDLPDLSRQLTQQVPFLKLSARALKRTLL
jgi:hypothetical protein